MTDFKPSFPFSLACLIVLAQPAGGEELSRRFDAKAGGKLTIELDRGRVDVFTHEADEVRLEARSSGLGASSMRLRARETADEVTLRAAPEPWLALMRSRPGVRVRAWVPADYRIEVRGGEGVELKHAPGLRAMRAPTSPLH